METGKTISYQMTNVQFPEQYQGIENLPLPSTTEITPTLGMLRLLLSKPRVLTNTTLKCLPDFDLP